MKMDNCLQCNSHFHGNSAHLHYNEIWHVCEQGSYGSWKTWKVLELYYSIFQDWIILEKGYWFWKVLEIC